MRKEKLLNLMNIRFERNDMIEPNPCWEGYEAIGTKMVDGKEVPNCVPIKENQKKLKFEIPTPEGGEAEEAYISRCMSAIAGEYDTQEQALAVCYAQLK
jgi:hypothetical protein